MLHIDLQILFFLGTFYLTPKTLKKYILSTKFYLFFFNEMVKILCNQY